eukprot:SAG22_NODE_798_length_7130_cov_4.576732_1_plen_400_part_00
MPAAAAAALRALAGAMFAAALYVLGKSVSPGAVYPQAEPNPNITTARLGFSADEVPDDVDRDSPTAAFLAALALLLLSNRTYRRALNCGLPAGLHYDIIHAFGVLAIGGRHNLVVTDHRHLKVLSKSAVHKADQPWTSFFTGCYQDAILGSVDETWERQRKTIHRLIHQHVGCYLDRLQRRCTADHGVVLLPPAASRRDNEGRGNGRGKAASANEVDLFRPVGAFVSAVSCGVLGLHSLEFEQEPITVNILHFMLLTTLSHRLGVPESIMRRLGTLVARRSAHDIQLRAAVVRAATLDETAAGAPTSVLKTLVDEFGFEQTIGHLWSITLGSVIPETTIACNILLRLAHDQVLQDEVRAMMVDAQENGGGDDDISKVARNVRFNGKLGGNRPGQATTIH